MNSHAEAEFSKFSALNLTGTGISWTRRSINGFGMSADTVVTSSRNAFYRKKPNYTPGISKVGGSGQEVSGWGQSGTWNPGDPTLVWKVAGVEQRSGSFITGDDTKGFGYTANGGSGEPGETIELQNVSVISGQSYPLIVPAGGQIKIGYFV